MKEEEIKIRVSNTLKTDFQQVCEIEETTMSNKINDYIVKEVNLKKVKNIMLNQKLIKFGIMNSNGRLYRKSELLKFKLDEDGFELTELDRINKASPLYGQFGYCDGATIIHKYNATHSVSNIRIDEDWLIGDVTILNESIIPILNNLIFRPRSYGVLTDKGVVTELEIIGFDAVLKTEDKFYDDDNESEN